MFVRLEFFINELFECRLSIDCERKQVDEENQLFQLQHLEPLKRHQRRDEDGDYDDRERNVRKPVRKEIPSSTRQPCKFEFEIFRRMKMTLNFIIQP